MKTTIRILSIIIAALAGLLSMLSFVQWHDCADPIALVLGVASLLIGIYCITFKY